MQSNGRKVIIQDEHQYHRDKIKQGKIIFIKQITTCQRAQKIKAKHGITNEHPVS